MWKNGRNLPLNAPNITSYHKNINNRVFAQYIFHYLLLLPSRVQGYRDDSDVLQTFEMQVPAAYYCAEGCGGGLAPDNNGTIYYWNYGECTGQDNCV